MEGYESSQWDLRSRQGGILSPPTGKLSWHYNEHAKRMNNKCPSCATLAFRKRNRRAGPEAYPWEENRSRKWITSFYRTVSASLCSPKDVCELGMGTGHPSTFHEFFVRHSALAIELLPTARVSRSGLRAGRNIWTISRSPADARSCGGSDEITDGQARYIGVRRAGPTNRSVPLLMRRRC